MKLCFKTILRVAAVLTLAASLILLSSCNSKSKRNPDVSEYPVLSEGDAAPDFSADLVGGKSFKLSDNKGKITIINIWATWCGPCVGEMPAFQMLLDEYGDTIAICAVNSGEDKEVVDKFVSENGYTFPIAYDPDYEICQKYPTDGIPYTVVIDSEGNVSKIFLGAADAEQQYKEYKKAIDAINTASNEIDDNNGEDNSNAVIEFHELNEGDSAPDFTADLVGGESFKLSDSKGKITLINIWATWCGPCVREMPAFQMLLDEYGDTIAICAVNCGEDKEVVDKFVSNNGYTFPIAYDPDYEICQRYPTDGIPYTVIIDSEGNVSKIFLGAVSAEQQYIEYKEAIEAIKAASQEG